MCECSQSPPKTVSKLTFDSKMTKNEIERPQMRGGRFCRRFVHNFWVHPDLFERRLRRPLAAALD